MASLMKEIWLDQIQENFYPDSSFLKYGQDYTQFVNANALNLATAGINPKVLINNTTYPIKVAERVDEPIKIELDKFETENTLVRRPEVIQYSYAQLESVIMGHRNELRAKTAEKAAHAYAPDKDSENTPVVTTSGEAYDGRKRLTFSDILALKERFDAQEVPLEDRFLVLHPSHVTDLISADVKGFKDITDLANGEPRRFAGFGILQFSRMPLYNPTTLVKLPWGEKQTGDTSFCSFAFQANEVMKADGEMFMYSQENDPKERATIIGFDKRFIAVPIRNVGVGAIVSSKS